MQKEATGKTEKVLIPPLSQPVASCKKKMSLTNIFLVLKRNNKSIRLWDWILFHILWAISFMLIGVLLFKMWFI